MKISKRQLKRIIKEEKRKLHEVQDSEITEVIKDSILELFVMNGEVRTQDVYDQLKSYGYDNTDIDLGMEWLEREY